MIIFIFIILFLDFMSLFVDFFEIVGFEGCEYSDRFIIKCSIRLMFGLLFIRLF